MSPLRTGCSPASMARSRTAPMAKMVFLLSRGIAPSVSSPQAGRAEAAGAASRFGQGVDLVPQRLLVTGDHHLGNAHAAGDRERLGAEVDEDHSDLATVV